MSFNGVVPAESCLSKIPPLQNPVFIADLHLAADKPATKEAFFKFLKNDAARFSELVILGDLFEFWAGDDHAPAYADILEALKAFFLNGHRIYVMHGNRDFLLGKGFTAATGAQLIADPIPVQVGFDHILLSHGDMWCTLDPEYQQFRATLRSPDVQRQILGEKLEHRIALAGGLRNQTTKKKARKSWMSSSMTSPVPCDNIEPKSLFTDIPTVLHTIRTSMKTRVSTAGYCLTGISKTVVPAAAT